ncbi:MAG: TRAP transporter small permease [Spirochaetales bacterium]|nr:TRAP transporter small permease [Spirochaetales bacterium]
MKKFFLRFEENIIFLLLPVTCVIITFSVFGRYTGLYNMYWSEELVRYLYIWVAFIGISMGVKSNAHFNVQLILNLLPLRIRKIIQSLATIIVIIFLSIVVYYSVLLLQNIIMMEQDSPMLGIPMYIPYAAITIGCFMMEVRVFIKMIHDLRYPSAAIDEGDDQ